jgi:uncharacterized protein (DUF3084 family)
MRKLLSRLDLVPLKDYLDLEAMHLDKMCRRHDEIKRLKDDLLRSDDLLYIRDNKIKSLEKELEGYKQDAHAAETKLSKITGKGNRLNRLEQSLKFLGKELSQWKGATKAWKKHLNRMGSK